MPLFGETVSTTSDIKKMFGGKGLNQAVACAKLFDKSSNKYEVAMLG